MRLDVACAEEEKSAKRPKEELDLLYKRELQKPSALGRYFGEHWLRICEASDLAAELLQELERLDESLEQGRGDAREVQTQLMAEYVTQCQALPFYGMTVFNVREWRAKETGKAKEASLAASRPDDEHDNDDEDDEPGKAKAKDKKQKKTKKKEKKKLKKVKHEKVPVWLGITRDCSLVKINPERNEVEMAWRIAQLRGYSLMLREGRERSRQARPIPSSGGGGGGPTPDDFIVTLDFGEFFPHYLQLLNRAPRGLLSKSPRHRLRDNALFRLDDSDDAIRILYVQIHSYIQQATGRAREERRRMEERLALYGLQERDVAGDGNCQMRALSFQLFGTEDKHVEVRQTIVKWLRNNPKYPVRESSSGRVIARLVDFLETDYHHSWSDYCAYMSKDKCWGDHMTLLAAAEIYSVNIWILSSVDITNEQGEESEPWSTIEPHLSRAQHMIRLAHWHDKHFSALTPQA